MTKIFLMLAALDLYWQDYFREQGRGVSNWGLSFGSWQGWGLGVSSVAYLVYCLWILREVSTRRRVEVSYVLLVLGGGVNLVSRLIWGSVWDYICFPWLPFCFNLSDLLISLGVLSYILRVNGYRSTVRG